MHIISTHTSLAGRDEVVHVCTALCRQISTHTSLAGRDWPRLCLLPWPRRFLLTRPSRDVTDLIHSILHFRIQFLLTRPSRDVTINKLMILGNSTISTHTSLAGRDWTDMQELEKILDFYSHVPRGT